MPQTSYANRRHLLYCPVNGDKCEVELCQGDRLFDIAVNDWTGSDASWDMAEFVFRIKGHKWPCIVENLPRIDREYDYYAFIDFDVRISTKDLNRLFRIGTALDLDLFQAALSSDSICHYSHLFANPRSLVRSTTFVEVMMPVFSRAALERCRWTLSESISGYGLDYLWSHVLEGNGMAVVDAVIAKHIRPIQSTQWKLEGGLTPLDELKRILTKYHISSREFRRTSPSIDRDHRRGKIPPQ